MPENDAEKIIIRNEEDAWNFLQDALDDQLPEGVFGIAFENWPVIDIKLEGEPFHASLTTKNMEGFLELQKNIYRSYALARYGKPNSQLITKEEKESLSFAVKVSEGSSGLQAALEGACKSFATGVAKNMDAQSVIIIALGAGLLWAGTVCWKAYLDHLREKNKIEAGNFSSEQETKRMEIMGRAMIAKPILVPIKENCESTYLAMLKSYTEADTVSLANQQLDGETVDEMVKSSRSKSQTIRLDGIYKIQKVDSSNIDRFKVVVLNMDNGQTFPADVKDSLVVAGRNKARLQKSEWERKPVYLKINAKEVRGQIFEAIILEIKEVPEVQE